MRTSLRARLSQTRPDRTRRRARRVPARRPQRPRFRSAPEYGRRDWATDVRRRAEDLDKGLEKVDRLAAEASAGDASLAVFPRRFYLRTRARSHSGLRSGTAPARGESTSVATSRLRSMSPDRSSIPAHRSHADRTARCPRLMSIVSLGDAGRQRLVRDLGRATHDDRLAMLDRAGRPLVIDEIADGHGRRRPRSLPECTRACFRRHRAATRRRSVPSTR